MSTIGPPGAPEPPRNQSGLHTESAKGTQLPSEGPALKKSFFQALTHRVVTFVKVKFGNYKEKKTAIDHLAFQYNLTHRNIARVGTFDRLARPFLLEHVDLATIKNPEKMAPFLELITLYSEIEDDVSVQKSVKEHLLASLNVPRENRQTLVELLDLTPSTSPVVKLKYVEACIEVAKTSTPKQMTEIKEKVENYFAHLQQAKEELYDSTDKSLILSTIRDLNTLLVTNSFGAKYENLIAVLRPLTTSFIDQKTLANISTPPRADKLEFARSLGDHFLECLAPLGGDTTENRELYNKAWEEFAKHSYGSGWKKFSQLVDQFEMLLNFVDRKEGPRNETKFVELSKALEGQTELAHLITLLANVELMRPEQLQRATEKRPVAPLPAQKRSKEDLFVAALATITDLGKLVGGVTGQKKFIQAWETLKASLPDEEFEETVIEFQLLIESAQRADPSNKELFESEKSYFNFHKIILEKHKALKPFIDDIYLKKFKGKSE